MKRIGLSLIITVIILSFGFVFVLTNSDTVSERGSQIGNSVKPYCVDQGDGHNKINMELDRTVGTVLGEDITARELELKAALYRAGGLDDPLGKAWDAIKKQVYEKQFAEEHGLTPTQDDIIEFTQQMRRDAEASEEGHAYAKALIEAAGMTEDEYWNEYKPIYESPAHLTHIRVIEYLDENGLAEISPDQIEGTLSDTAILSEF